MSIYSFLSYRLSNANVTTDSDAPTAHSHTHTWVAVVLVPVVRFWRDEDGLARSQRWRQQLTMPLETAE